MKRFDAGALVAFLIIAAAGVSGGVGYRIGCHSVKTDACQCGDKCECCQCGKPSPAAERAPIEAGPVRDAVRRWRETSAIHTTLVRLEIDGNLKPDEKAAVHLIRNEPKAFAALHAKIMQQEFAKGYVEANGDFLKWLITAFWKNRDAILQFIMEIVKIFHP